MVMGMALALSSALRRNSSPQRLATLSISLPSSPKPSHFHSHSHSPTNHTGFFRRFFQKGPTNKLMDKFKWIGSRDLFSPLPPPPPTITVDDARKLFKFMQIEKLKSTLRNIPDTNISYSQFLQICIQCSTNADQGLELANTLDQSGAVIVLKDVVFLHPEEIVKTIQDLIFLPNAPQPELMRELENMENEKSYIDRKAEARVRRELWCGLGFGVLQTTGLMRLTFWELSWDVMEPICFYLTSIYFMATYTFYLRTAQEPTFQGFYKSRFHTKQKRLMKARNFDMERYNELRRTCHPNNSNKQKASGSSKIYILE